MTTTPTTALHRPGSGRGFPIQTTHHYYNTDVAWADDTGTMLAIGHLENRQAIAAFNALCRHTTGAGLARRYPMAGTWRIQHRWVVRIVACTRCLRRITVDSPAAAATAATRLTASRCRNQKMGCIPHGWQPGPDTRWVLDWADRRRDKAFPVTVWNS